MEAIQFRTIDEENYQEEISDKYGKIIQTTFVFRGQCGGRTILCYKNNKYTLLSATLCSCHDLSCPSRHSEDQSQLDGEWEGWQVPRGDLKKLADELLPRYADSNSKIMMLYKIKVGLIDERYIN